MPTTRHSTATGCPNDLTTVPNYELQRAHFENEALTFDLEAARWVGGLLATIMSNPLLFDGKPR
jgi:hypothetical protein